MGMAKRLSGKIGNNVFRINKKSDSAEELNERQEQKEPGHSQVSSSMVTGASDELLSSRNSHNQRQRSDDAGVSAVRMKDSERDSSGFGNKQISTSSSSVSNSNAYNKSRSILNRRLSAVTARNMSMRRNSFEIFDGYSSSEIFAGIRNMNAQQTIMPPRRASDPSAIGKGVDIENSHSAREYITWIMDVGDAREQYGKYNEALLAFREALRVQQMMLGKGHAETAKTLTRIGGVLGQMNMISDALTNLTEALRIHRNRRGEDFKVVAHTYMVTGIVYKRSGDLEKAMASYREALRLQQLMPEKDTTTIAIIYNNIGNIHYDQKHFVAAMESYILCIKSGNPWNKGYVHTASKLHSIGSTLCQYNCFDHGLRAYKEALEVRRLTLEGDNLDIASTLQGIADVYERKGKLEHALKYYAEAFSIMHTQLGPENALVVHVSYRIGVIKSYLKSGSSRKIFKEIQRKRTNRT